MLTFGIRARLLLLLIVVTSLPLLLLNLYWTNAQRGRLTNAAKSHQAVITQNAADRVDAFLNEKIRALIIHSQSNSMQQLDTRRATTEMEALIYQDKDLQRVSLAGKDGKELIAINNDLKPSELKSLANDDAFKVVSFLAGKEYISPVRANANGHPAITIAVPLIAFTKPQDLGTISTAEPGIIRNSEDIKGVLLADISLESLWNSVLANAKNRNAPLSYAYVVDDKGIVIAHPDSTYTNQQRDVSRVPIIAAFLQNRDTTVSSSNREGDSEKSVASLATYQTIPTAKWAVVFQEPTSSLFANINQVSRLGFVLTLLAIAVATILSFFLSRYVTSPILKITAAAESIGEGNFDTQVATTRTDEIGTLAMRINAMGQSLKNFVARIETERNQLEVILNSNAESIIAVNKDKKIMIANKAASKLAQHTSLVGQTITELMPWTQNKKPFIVDYGLSSTNTYEGLEYVSPDGVTHYIDLVVAHVDGSSEGVQAIVTIHDETKSRDLDKMKVDFVSMAAHELRTPITAIRGYLELIMYKFSDGLSVQVTNYIQQTHKSALELIGLINNLLNISRIERGALTLNMEQVDWAGSLVHTSESLQFNAQEKNITLTYEGPQSGCFIVADAVAIQEVINNLVSNAIKYTPDHGIINIKLRQEGDEFITEVTDSGIGIPANSIPNLFTKFYRVHGGLASGSGGTGLGLFISKSIVERHKGKIWVQSEEGVGSTFTFTLPVFSEERLGKYQHSVNQNVRRQRGWVTKNITR